MKKKSLDKTKKLIKETILPNRSLNFLDRIDRLEKIYFNYISTGFNGLPKETHNKLRDFWDSIRKCFLLHKEGLAVEATQLFYEKIFCNESFIDIYELAPKSRLFRMRTSEYGGLFSKEEMFHIRFDKRHLVLNNRFCVNGIPSLYLGESTYICWEEMGCPNFDTCNISMFINDKPLFVINLAPILEGFDIEKILKYPLAYVCSLGANHYNAPFKEEYVIPQMLMQCLLIHNKTNPESSCVGIRYLSNKAYIQRPLFPLNEKEDLKRYFNYAFPAFGPYDEQFLSVKLQSLFSWSAPETYGRYRLRHANTNIEERPSMDTYGCSAFFQIENWCYMRWIHDNVMSYDSLEGALTI